MRLIRHEDKLNSTPMVSIFCNTYNQVGYISKCLDGFLSQETVFPFEVLVTDDASTDGTAEVVASYVEAYPNLFVAVLHEENQFSKGINHNRDYLWPLSRGQFIAFCEGDDWWTDSFKLQKQFDAMMASPTASWCVHASDFVDEEGKFLHVSRSYETDSILKFAEVGQQIQLAATASFFVRREVYDCYLSAFPSGVHCHGDFKMSRFFSLLGDTIYLSQSMSAYRCFAQGSINSSIANRYDWRDALKQNMESRIEYLESLNVWSNNEYSEEISDQIDFIKYSCAIELRDYKTLHEDYLKRYVSEPKTVKAKVEILGRCPRLQDLLRKIKHKHFKYVGMKK